MSGGAARVYGGAGSFGARERRRQAAFRKGLTAPSDAIGQRHDYLLALGCEEENLYPSPRGEHGACRYFAERGIKWWQAHVSGDASGGKRPTRNMASSQIACANFLLPLIDIPGALTAVLQAIDNDVTGVVDIEHQGTSSPVELEWIGLDHALEGPSVKSRGANSTSVDAFMVAETPSGRRAYLMEWKYVEEYRTEDKGQGRQGETRRRRCAHLVEASIVFSVIGKAKLIIEKHGDMKDRLALAEERANNWLKAIYAISILFFVGVIALVAFLMHMAAKNRRVDIAMRTVESVNLSPHDRNLLMASLGGRIIEQPRDDEGDQ